MTDDEIIQYRKRAIRFAISKGFERHAEDIAQITIASFADGSRNPKYFTRSVLDAIREVTGRFTGKNKEKNRKESNAILNASSSKRLKFIKDTHGLPGSGLDFQSFLDLFHDRERAIICLYYKWGFLVSEIGDVFGVPISTSSFWLGNAKRNAEAKMKQRAGQ